MNRTTYQLLNEMGLNPDLPVVQDSVTSHNWCDSNDWPSTDNSLYELSVESITGKTEGVAVYMPRGILRCRNTEISEVNPLLVKYHIGDVVVETTVYDSLSDFQKRATKGGVVFAGDIWEIVLNFEEDGTPVVLWPESMASGLVPGDPIRLTKISIQIHEDIPCPSGPDSGASWAYVRYPGMLVLDTPEG